MSDARIHHVSCSLTSGPAGTDTFDRAEALANRLNAYARKLGFSVMSENVDRAEPGDPVSECLL